MEGQLDNTTPGKVTGWILFYREGKDPLRVTLDLAGDCHRDLQGKKFRILNPNPSERDPYEVLRQFQPNENFPERQRSYVDGLNPVQTGNVGDITAGDEPRDYVDYPYIEWYSDANGRVVLELQRDQLEILTGLPAGQAGEPTKKPRKLDRKIQHRNMAKFVEGMLKDTGALFGAVVGDPSHRGDEVDAPNEPDVPPTGEAGKESGK